MRNKIIAPGFIVLLSVLALAGCAESRVHRLTDREYRPKPAEAPIDMYVGQLARPYESIAIVDSESYALSEQDKDEKSAEAKEKNAELKERMLNDLKRKARLLGGDAVQDIRLLPVKIRGMVPDPRVPIPGAMMQGARYKHFLRGEVVRYVEEPGQNPSPSESEAKQSSPETGDSNEDAEASKAEPSKPAAPASPATIRNPSLANENPAEEELPPSDNQ